MKKLALMIALTVSTVAHAETWRYVDTIDLGVQVFVDQDSIQPAEHWSNRKVTIATMFPKGEAVLLNLEVNCQHKTIKTSDKWYSTQPALHGGRLVKMICTHKL